MQLGHTIAHHRKIKRYSQGDLAKEIGVSQTYLSLIENGKKEPALSLLKRIAVVLEVPLPILFLFSLEEDDVADSKKSIFKDEFDQLKKSIGELLADNT